MLDAAEEAVDIFAAIDGMGEEVAKGLLLLSGGHRGILAQVNALVGGVGPETADGQSCAGERCAG